MNRGVDHMITFGDDNDRSRFLWILSDSMREFDVEVLAYCLMGNHYHLMLRSQSGRLSEATRYVHRNPLEIAGVTSLDAYLWSSYRAYLGLADTWAALVNVGPVLSQFGEGRNGYRAFVESGPKGEWKPPLLSVSDPPDETDSVADPDPDPGSDLDRVLLAVLEATHSDPTELLTPRRGRPNLARSIGMYLGIVDLGLEAKRLAEVFATKPATVRSVVSRMRRRVSADDELASLVQQIRSQLARKGATGSNPVACSAVELIDVGRARAPDRGER